MLSEPEDDKKTKENWDDQKIYDSSYKHSPND